jgi:GTP-binding protein HflX
MITVLNKVDALSDKKVLAPLKKSLKPCVEVSAVRGEGIDALLAEIERQIDTSMSLCKFHIPIDEMDIVHLIHEKGKVKSEKYDADKVILEARVSEITASRLRNYLRR